MLKAILLSLLDCGSKTLFEITIFVSGNLKTKVNEDEVWPQLERLIALKIVTSEKRGGRMYYSLKELL